MNNLSIKDGLTDGFPIIIGFIPISLSFGILCKSAELTLLQSLGFSMLVFAGASQFIAINLLIAGGSIGEIIFTTLLVNFRHFLFAASLSTKFSEVKKKYIPLIAFGLTDEIFSIASLKKRALTKNYLITLESCAYFSLAFGTFLGYILGSILPNFIKLSMGIALYALFTAILIPEIKKSFKILIILILSGTINSFCFFALNIPQGWSIIISIILSSFFGLIINNLEVYHE